MLRLTAAAFVSLLKTKLVNTLARGGSWGGGLVSEGPCLHEETFVSCRQVGKGESFFLGAWPLIGCSHSNRWPY